MLARRQLAPDDYGVFEDGQLIGRIRLARGRTLGRRGLGKAQARRQ